MKTVLWIVVLLFVLVLDWAALHDIFLGSEPSYTQEWTWLVVSTLALAGTAWFALRGRRGQGSSTD